MLKTRREVEVQRNRTKVKICTNKKSWSWKSVKHGGFKSEQRRWSTDSGATGRTSKVHEGLKSVKKPWPTLHHCLPVMMLDNNI